jgi:hypothetical protein
MLIICSGPDSYRAREKARELMAAFRKKFDPSGQSTERIDVSQGITNVLNKLGAASLFSSKKFIRTDGLLKKISAADLARLDTRLASDNDQTILVTVEDSPPPKTITDKLKTASVHSYSYPLLEGVEFRNWVRENATRFGVSQQIADKVSTSCSGDSWCVINELQKQAVNPQDVIGLSGEESIFRIVDNAIANNLGWRTWASEAKETGFVSALLFQLRSYERIKSGDFSGIKPFVVSKMRNIRIRQIESRIAASMRALVGTRSGLCDDVEALTILQ